MSYRVVTTGVAAPKAWGVAYFPTVHAPIAFTLFIIDAFGALWAGARNTCWGHAAFGHFEHSIHDEKFFND